MTANLYFQIVALKKNFVTNYISIISKNFFKFNGTVVIKIVK